MNMQRAATITLFFIFFAGEGECQKTEVNDANNGDSGTFLGFGQVFKENLDYQQNAYGNSGISTGTDDRRTGTSLFSRGGSQGDFQGSDLKLENNAKNNYAGTDTGSASSGVISVFNTISQSSNIDTDSESSNNVAQVNGPTGSGRNVDAIGGIEQQLIYLKNSDFHSVNNADTNSAYNNGDGRAIAGVVNTFGYTKGSKTDLENTATDNTAESENGKAIAGIQNNVDKSKNTANTWENTASGNTATANNGAAVAGVQNNLNTVKNNGNGNRKGDALTTTDTATNNEATSYNGKAISGVQINIDNFKNGDATMDVTAQGNKAKAYDNQNSVPGQSYDAVAGFALNVRRITNSGNGNKGGFSVTGQAKDNTAKNYQTTGGDAIAGIDVNLGRVKNSDVTFDLDSQNNNAYSASGDAIAATDVKVNRAVKSNVDTGSVTSSGATANAPQGNAIIDTTINVNEINTGN